MSKITSTDCVLALKQRRTSHSAQALAEAIKGTTSRAVATALRGPVRDGLVSLRFYRGVGWYRFVRLNKKASAP